VEIRDAQNLRDPTRVKEATRTIVARILRLFSLSKWWWIEEAMNHIAASDHPTQSIITSNNENAERFLKK